MHWRTHPPPHISLVGLAVMPHWSCPQPLWCTDQSFLKPWFGAAGANQTVQPLLDYQRRDRRDIDHLMVQRTRILALQQHAAMAAGVRGVHHLIHPFDRQQHRACSGMTRLRAALAAIALSSSGGLNPLPSLEGGLEELRELRPICPRRLASSVARALSWLRSC